MIKPLIALLLAASLAGASAVPTAAQGPNTQTTARVPVTIVLVNQLPHNAAEPFLVQRRANANEHDVILLRASSATPKNLEEALQTILTARQAGGDLPVVSGTYRLRPGAHAGAPTKRRAIPWAGRVLADLRRAEPRDVPGVGLARAVQVWLPPQRAPHSTGGPPSRSSII